MTEIIIKANDGRGRGHIGRVINFIDDYFGDRAQIIAHKGFADMIPEDILNIMVTDMKWRCNLDYPNSESLYFKHGNLNGSKIHTDPYMNVYYATKIFCRTHKIPEPRNLEQDKSLLKNTTLQKALERYYFSALKGTGVDTRLFYVDDQNDPSTLFPEKIAERLLLPNPGSIRHNAPNAKITFEVETQIWDNVGREVMGTTRRNAFIEADYLHLSTSAKFFNDAVGDYTFQKAGQSHIDEKIIPMGFPVGTHIRNIFDSVQQDGYAYERTLNNLYDLIELPDAQKNNRLCYVTFGGGSGSDEVYETLLEAIDKVEGFNFVVANTCGIENVLKDKYEIIDSAHGNVKTVLTDDGNKMYLVKHPNQVAHLKNLAIADVTIQGNGSGQTYETIAAQVPMVCIPLVRPAYEQIIKGHGVAKAGAGHALYLKDVEKQLDGFESLTNQNGQIERNKFTSDNIVDKLVDIADNESFYSGNLDKMQGLIADPAINKRVIEFMANGYEPNRIIRELGLEQFRR